MGQLDALWIYQEADLKVDRYETEIRQNPMRRKLVKLKNYFKEQQDAMKAIEISTDKAEKSLASAQGQYEALSERLVKSTSDIREENFETAMQVRSVINGLSDIIARLSALEQRLDALVKEAAQLTVDLRNARVNAAKARNEYTDLKVKYDEEFAKQSQVLDELTAQRDGLKEGISPEVLRRYYTIKKRCVPPMAMLNGDQCGGCNMALPALIISNAKKGAGVVECETCGRILYITE